jgi:murein DD-endopeptidase MepM/ murein hydrolase activator NlpD
MRALLIGLGFVVALVLGALFLEPFAPTVSVDGLGDAIGRGTPLRVTARDRGSGLSHVEVRLVPADGAEPLVLARQDFPRTSWFGSGVYESTLAPTLGANVPVPEGKATLEVYASDHSLLSAVRRAPRYAHSVLVDVTPPALSVVGKPHVARLGSSDLAILKVGADAVSSGVQVGDLFFPASSGVFKDADLRPVIFALPENSPGARPVAVATDGAGNRAEATLDVQVQPRKFAEKKLAVTDTFLQRKVPELLAQNGMPPSDNLLDGYLRINRELRQTTEARIRDLCATSAPAPQWTEGFMRMPGAPLSGFADRRTYTHDGTVIDHQTHLGHDIASLKNAVVPGANAGRVVFVGPLGIYGNAVIIDHGLGLFSLYGHLSEASVTEGAQVARGDPVGKTGDTGLAAGDHLHFSMMVHGVHVDAGDWWDGHWVGDRVLGPLAEHQKAAPPSAPAPSPSPTTQESAP